MSVHSFSANSIIALKRDGGKISADQFNWFIHGLVSGEVELYHASALLMAIYLNGCDQQETANLTQAMLSSGKVLEFQNVRIVDKHSTGGVGDKTSLILAPIAASAGVLIPMISGRGLGHTGGTVDKLESIPGFNTSFSCEEFLEIFKRIGLIICGQNDDFAPADKILYQLRSSTGTVASIPLITASILSKKLAEGTHGLLMDIKVGPGAFMQTLEEARALAKSVQDISSSFDKSIMTLITDMSQPLGKAIGNANEIVESIETLKGHGPQDLTSLSVELAAGMIYLAQLATSMDDARARAWDELLSGRALKKFSEMIAAQGGEVKVLEDYSLLRLAEKSLKVTAPSVGFIIFIDVCRLGDVICRLGGGRKKSGESIDHGVGIINHARLGQFVNSGDLLAEIQYRSDQEELALEIMHELQSYGYRIGENSLPVPELIQEIHSNLIR